MKEEIKNYYRQDLFNYYHKRSNPFVFVTTKIDMIIAKYINTIMQLLRMFLVQL